MANKMCLTKQYDNLEAISRFGGTGNVTTKK